MFGLNGILFGCGLLLVSILVQLSFSLPALELISYDTDIDSEINSYKNAAQEIIDFVTKGAGKHQTYDRLAAMADKFGNRLVGSENLENVIDYMLEQLKADGLENVHGEQVTNVPHWVRGDESATLLEPRRYEMSILGLGGSIGTPGITAEVMVVHSFDELHARAAEVSKKNYSI